jgi:hypothetical protein
MLVSKEASFARAMPHKAAKTWAATFCPASLALGLPFCKNCYALPALMATIVFSAFGRSFFADGRGIQMGWYC